MIFLVEILVLLVVMIGVLAPVLLWFERRRAVGVLSRVESSETTFSGWRSLALFFPPHWVDALSRPASGPSAPFARLAPSLAFLSLLLLVSLVPVGGRYVVGGVSLRLVAAPVEWGLVLFFFLASIAVGAYSLRFVAERGAAVEASSAGLSWLIAMAATLAGPILVYGTQNFADIPVAQDRTVGVLDWLVALGWIEGSGPSWLRLPGWGVFVQPLAFLLFLPALLALCPRPDLESDIGPGEEAPALALWMAADLLRVAVAGAILTVFFFGGWAIPYASQASIISWFAELGEGIGSIVCLVLHVASFVVKVSAFLFAYSAVRLALPRLDSATAMRSCWRVILPLSVANVVFTALVLLAMERNP